MTTIQLADAPSSVKAIQTSMLPPQKRCRMIQHALRAGASFERFGAGVPATLQTISGQGTISSEDKQAELRPGTLASLRPDQACRISASSDLVILVSEYLSAATPC